MYSLNNQYPQELPSRIRLSNGQTRTDPTTFTPEEIADAGYILVPDPPIFGQRQTLTWSGTEWVITDNRTLESAKQLRIVELKEIRQLSEKNFTFSGMSIYLDEETQARINGAITGFNYAPEGTTTPWEVKTGVFIELNGPTLLAMGQAAWEHVRQCFINSKNITASINACETIAQVDAIDLEVGWPNE